MTKTSLKVNQPTAYQTGFVEFYKLRFKVTKDVLIPRPETELLVDEVLKFVNGEWSIVNGKTNNKPSTINNKLSTISHTPYTILDLGTGSGNIAISIAKNATNVKIIAIDVSKKALEIAKQNAKLHNVLDQITFIQSNLLSTKNSLLRKIGTFDLIVTNLPYIPSKRIPTLDSSVKDYEPHLALDGGGDGFDLYRKLFKQIKTMSLQFKLFVGEIDHTQGDIAYNEAKKYFPDSEVEIKFDLSHKQRILLIRSIL